MSDAPFSCNACGRGWTGFKECHCPTCHESFSTEANFDRHRVFGVDGDWNTRRCLAPGELAALKTKSGLSVLMQSERKHGSVWVSAGTFPTSDASTGGVIPAIATPPVQHSTQVALL